MSLLAQIIAGEAQRGNNGDSYGVAATIYNRTIGASGYRGPGYGLSPLAAATAPGQFEAYGANKLGTPTPYQQQLADSLENGTFASQGNPGNATYYNAPGFAYAPNGSNTYGSGSNVFSDGFQQQPSSNFQLPQASDPSAAASGGAGAGEGGPGEFVGITPNGGETTAYSDTGSLLNTPGTAGGFDQQSGLGPLGATPDQSTGPLAGTAPGTTIGPSVGEAGFSNPLAFPSSSSTPSNATPVSPTTGNPIQPQAGAGSGATAGTAPTGKAPSSQGGAGTGGGAPIDITNAPQVGTQAAGTIASGATTAANTLSKALGGVTSGAAADTASAEGTGTSWLNSIFGAGENVLIRGGFILIGLVILLGAFLFFWIDSKSADTPQVVPV